MTSSTESTPASSPGARSTDNKTNEAGPSQTAPAQHKEDKEHAEEATPAAHDSSPPESPDATEEPTKAPASDAAPPLPDEPVPQAQDDGWDCHWDQNSQSWFFYNRFTQQTTWENPRIPTTAAVAAAPGTTPTTSAPGTAPPATVAAPSLPAPPLSERPAAGGYNPAIHGDYDPNAWYAKGDTDPDAEDTTAQEAAAAVGLYGSTVTFNRFTGQFQTADEGPERHSDEAKARRQMNAYFDVDAAANSHDGRSLKAERSGKKPTKSELKHFKEKRRARKEEKRRAWLRD